MVVIFSGHSPTGRAFRCNLFEAKRISTSIPNAFLQPGNSARLSPVVITGSAGRLPSGSKKSPPQGPGASWPFLLPSPPNPSVIFSCHTFCKPARIRHSAILIPQATFRCRRAYQPCKAKRRYTPTASTVPLMPGKNNPKRLKHNVILWKQTQGAPLRFGDKPFVP